ncbi:MAG: TonB-dependent hemoglobin/transferrin/lactoferrin family receptor [Rhizobiaceae bacterium]
MKHAYYLSGTAMVVLALAASQAAARDGLVREAQGEAAVPAATTLLDQITITATMASQAVIDALSGTSLVSGEEVERIQAVTAADLFRQVPGVRASMSGDDPATAINIRGLQQMGRVAVTVDGARQDYWRVGHGSGSFFLEPELLKQVTVIRGPVSNAHGTGAIGGVVAFETKAAGDFLRAHERWAISEKVRYESNGQGWLSSTTGAYRFNDNFDVIGNFVARTSREYRDGNGDVVRWTGEDGLSGYGKVTLRPADGHEIKLGAIVQRFDDVISGSSGSNSATLSRYDASTVVQNYTANYSYDPFDNDYWDLDLNLYHSTTRSDQRQVWPTSAIGNSRYYDVATTGFNLRNASRFTSGAVDHTLTYGGDFAHLTGDSDADHFGKGRQIAYGAFVQWEGQYDRWLDVTGALRYDGYRLDGASKPTPTEPARDVSLSGQRWSPRVTVGVTPLDGIQLYATYAEGYRTPHLQEVFRQNGAHGSGYEPNLFLRPEVARSWEGGVNLKFDDLIAAGDMFRAKINLFHSDVRDYVSTVSSGGVTQARNVGTARLQGIEMEGVYDFGRFYVSAAASFTNATMLDGPNAGETLSNTPLENAGVTVGFRALEDRLTWGVQYQSIGRVVRQLSSGSTVYPRVDLVSLFANWDINDSVRLDAGVDNLFDKAYTDPQSGWSTTSNIEQGKGRTFKISLTGRFGG